MRLCCERHDEIVFDQWDNINHQVRKCPACDLAEQNDELQALIEKLEDEINELKEMV